MSCGNVILGSIQHHQGSRLDYSIDWSKWLEVGDTIQTSTWSTDSGLQISDMQISAAGDKTSAYVEGGVSGKNTYLTNTITTLKLKDSRVIKLIHT